MSCLSGMSIGDQRFRGHRSHSRREQSCRRTMCIRAIGSSIIAKRTELCDTIAIANTTRGHSCVECRCFRNAIQVNHWRCGDHISSVPFGTFLSDRVVGWLSGLSIEGGYCVILCAYVSVNAVNVNSPNMTQCHKCLFCSFRLSLLPTNNLREADLSPPAAEYNSVMAYNDAKLCNILYGIGLAKVLRFMTMKLSQRSTTKVTSTKIACSSHCSVSTIAVFAFIHCIREILWHRA